MNIKELVFIQKYKDKFSYDPITGILTNKKTGLPSDKKHISMRVSGLNVNMMYVNIYIKEIKKRYQLGIHRIAFYYMTGKFPIKWVDHINQDTTDNRWENLRECNEQTSTFNRSRRFNAMAKYKGLNFHNNKWRVYICKSNKDYYLGCYESQEIAGLHYNNAALELHGVYACLNPIYCPICNPNDYLPFL